jgi:1-acyl-sn-glycerol-3-phosphate acyltransferase
MVLKMFLRFLEKGENILIFPEGKRSPDGSIQPLEGGVALLSLKSRCSILPVYVYGTFSALPSGKTFPRAVKIIMNYGFPIDPSSLPENMTDREARAEILDRLAIEYRRLEAEAFGQAG